MRPADYCTSGAPFSPLRLAFDNGECIYDDPTKQHNVGEVWCVTLWEARARMIEHYGFAGNQIMLQLVTDGMVLCPPNPNFVQARDAFFQAVMVDGYCESDWDSLWAAFKKRGLGRFAASPDSRTTTGVVESFVYNLANPCQE